MKIINLKIGMFSCLNEFMKISEYKWSRSFFDFWPKILILWHFLSPQKPTVTKLSVEPSGAEGTKICFNSPGYLTNIADMPVDRKKPLKIFFSGPMDRWPLKYIQNIRYLNYTKIFQTV